MKIINFISEIYPRAKHRARLHSKMDCMEFPEMTVGFPVPVNYLY